MLQAISIGGSAMESAGWTLYPGFWNNADKATGYSVEGGDLVANTDSAGGSVEGMIRGTLPLSGKMYWHNYILIMASQGGGLNNGIVGVANEDAPLNSYPGNTADSWSYIAVNGTKGNNASFSAYGATWAVYNVITTFVDMGSTSIWWAKNGVVQNSGDPLAGTGAAFTNLSGDFIYPCAGGVGLTVAGKFGLSGGALALLPP